MPFSIKPNVVLIATWQPVATHRICNGRLNAKDNGGGHCHVYSTSVKNIHVSRIYGTSLYIEALTRSPFTLHTKRTQSLEPLENFVVTPIVDICRPRRYLIVQFRHDFAGGGFSGSLPSIP
ncbi:hypothetical protein L1887_21382 [Cichorium endivia]|nr:hypothetical protein L1887_21382 [Cichorium endivia]